MSTIKERVREIKVEIQRLEFDLTLKKSVLQELESLGPKKSRKPSNRKSKPPRKGSLAACLQKVLQEANCALSVNQLVARAKQAGFVTTANVGLNNLVPSAMVRREDIFVRVRHGVYDLENRRQKTGNGIVTE